MIKVGLGQSEHIDTRSAVESVISQCREKLSGDQPHAGVVFAGINFDHRLMLDFRLDHHIKGIKSEDDITLVVAKVGNN
jgi:hypothetical protein